MSIQDTRLWEKIDGGLEFIFTPAWKWPTGIRHLYIATLPLALILRTIAGIVFFATLCALYLTDSATMYFVSIWRGERPELKP